MRLAILALALALSACALAPRQPDKRAPEPDSPLARQESVAPGANAAARAALAQASTLPDEEYRIGPSDLLEVSVFQVPDLNRTVRVNSRGLISLPLLGAVSAAGLSATELEDQIAAKLAENYLQNPQVSVFIKEFTSQRVTIEGQVEKAGIYPIAGNTTTLLQALALAGGVKELAETSVSIFRLADGGKRQLLEFDMERIRAGAVVDPTLRNNDIVVVGKDESRSFVKNLTDTLRGFITFGRY